MKNPLVRTTWKLDKKIEAGLKGYHYLIFLAVVLLWLFSWWFVSSKYNIETDAGPFGDMFGFINSLFSGLAFAGIIITVVLQNQELREQRKELSSTRGILDEQKLEMAAQVKAMNAQVAASEKQSYQLKTRDSDGKASYSNATAILEPQTERFESTFFAMIDIHLTNCVA